jgi:hypothetical protein
MIHLFKISDMDPLKCHKEDCVLNVLHYLKILNKNKAFKIANVNDQILIKDLIDFLTYIYGVPHGITKIYEAPPLTTKDKVEDVLEEQNVYDLLENELKENMCAICLLTGTQNHLALFANIENSIFYLDPQSGEEVLMMDDSYYKPNRIGEYLYPYNEIYLVTSESKKNKQLHFNTNKFEKTVRFYTNKARILKKYNVESKTVANNISNTLKWTQHTLQHRGLKPLKKYKIIKKPNKEVRDSVFLRFEENQALAVFKDITVPTVSHFFIELPESPKRRKSFNNFKKSKKSKTRKSKIHSI